jgi:hypothetical protein
MSTLAQMALIALAMDPYLAFSPSFACCCVSGGPPANSLCLSHHPKQPQLGRVRGAAVPLLFMPCGYPHVCSPVALRANPAPTRNSVTEGVRHQEPPLRAVRGDDGYDGARSMVACTHLALVDEPVVSLRGGKPRLTP